MKNYNNVKKKESDGEFHIKETSRPASSKRISVEQGNLHIQQAESQRLLMESRQICKQFEMLNTQLTHRSRELEEENFKLKLANHELEALNYTVSHDLRTPLTAICMYAQAVLKHCGNNLDEQCKTSLISIFSQTRYMNQLVNSMLDFSRASCKEIEKELVDLSSMAKKIAANLKLNDPERTADIKIADGIKASGDKCLLQEVLENIIGNAWKYTAMNESTKIEFGVTEHDGKPAYFVRDNGIGFDMNQAAKLFGIFQRLHCNDEFKGYGIGLAAVKRIIQRHGGEVWADGAVGEGATFYFTL